MSQINRHFLSTLAILATLLISPFAKANFQLETMTVIVDAADERKAFSVKNTSKDPILLSTQVNDIDGAEPMAQNILVSPPIIRIDPEQSQQVNFVLKKGTEIPHEMLLKASFQGVGATKENVTKMPIRQDIALIVTPPGITVSQTPWDNLNVSQKGELLTLINTGKQVIRLAPNFTTLPDNTVQGLEQFYLRPNESKTVKVKGEVKEIKISPLSRFGFKTPNDATILVTR